MEIYKKKTVIASLVLAFLLLSTSITLVVAQEPSRMAFRGIANGGGTMVWGASMGPGFMYGNPEYITAFDKGSFNITGTGLLKETNFDPLGPEIENIENWELENIRSSSFMSVKWIENTGTGEENHKLRVRFKIADETDSVYTKARGYFIGGYENAVIAEVLLAGINLDNYDPENLEEAMDPQSATMTFEGTYDNQEIEGNANVLSFYAPTPGFIVEAFEAVLVNLWINDLNTYAHFSWWPVEGEVSDPTIIFPAARVLRVRFKLI